MPLTEYNLSVGDIIEVPGLPFPERMYRYKIISIEANQIKLERLVLKGH